MKHALSFYIDDDTDIIGFCGSIIVKTGDNKSISSFNLNEEQLITKNTWHIEQDGKGKVIATDQRECALEVVREELNNGGPFAYEEWCTCTHCGFRHALFIPREYCPKCGYKFTSTINKGVKAKEDKEEK